MRAQQRDREIEIDILRNTGGWVRRRQFKFFNDYENNPPFLQSRIHRL